MFLNYYLNTVGRLLMLGWIIRILLIIAGFIASFFVARDALNFDVVQMIVAVILFTSVITVIAFWPMLIKWLRETIKKRD